MIFAIEKLKENKNDNQLKRKQEKKEVIIVIQLLSKTTVEIK
jgi:hypothetical protein